jgi:hypothetical protein
MSEFVKGQCPLCGSGVFVGSCGWLTCSGSECPDPLFVGEIFEKYKESNSNLGELMRIVKQLEAMTVPAPRPHYFVQEEDEVVATCLHCGETDDGEETSNCEPVPAPHYCSKMTCPGHQFPANDCFPAHTNVVPASRLECPDDLTHESMFYFMRSEFPATEYTGEPLFCPRCGTALSPPVGPTKRNRGRNGVILACGCWTANVLVGMRAGADAVQCPNGHGSSLIAEANIDEFAPVPEGEGEVPNCIWMIHDGNPTSWNYCPNCGAYLKAAAPPVGTQPEGN